MFNTTEGQRLVKFGGIMIVFLMVFLAAQVLYTLKLTANIDDRTPATSVISVYGKGEVFAVPDIANFTFGADETAKTVAEAQKLVTDKINKGTEILKDAGVEEKDIKTVGYNIYPHYEYTQTICTQFNCPPGKQIIDGYQVTQTIQVKVRDTSKAGTILGKLGAAQLNNVSGLNFTIDDEDKLLAEAKEKAIADAQEQAKKLAKDLGVRLGKVVSYYDDNPYPYPAYDQSYAKEAMSVEGIGAVVPEVPAGENQIVSTVSITYEIK